MHIDEHFDPGESVVLRYQQNVRLEDDESADAAVKALLPTTSIREGVRIVPFMQYRGVQIDVLDETSLMHTHTLKAIDGCVTAAKCRARGITTLVIESGGNSAAAVAAYADRARLAIACFVPEQNLELLDASCFRGERTQLIAVADPALVKEAATRFARQTGALHVPEVGWRFQASRFVGCFLREHLLRGARIDWLAQTISAAFGPIGIYDALSTPTDQLPRFLGVQQAANCPMYRAWKGEPANRTDDALRSTTALLAPVMYDGAPATYGTFPALQALLVRTRGHLVTIDTEEFAYHIDAAVIDALHDGGINILRRGPDIIDRTGLIALAGVLKEIGAGSIATHSRVLVCLTSGVRPAYQAPMPSARLTDLDGIDTLARPWTT